MEDRLGRAADSLDGAWAMLAGAAANRCFASGLPVAVGELVPGLAHPAHISGS